MQPTELRPIYVTRNEAAKLSLEVAWEHAVDQVTIDHQRLCDLSEENSEMRKALGREPWRA